MAPLATAAVLLRSHDYGDSSRILRFYTRDHGLLSVVARGVRGRSGKGTATLATFASGDLMVYVKSGRDLHTMKDFTCRDLREGIGADVLRFAGASAVAELVLAHVETEPQPAVFEALEHSLDALSTNPGECLPGTVLGSLWRMTEAFGFAPQLEICVRCGTPIGAEEFGRFDFAAGGVRCSECSDGAAGPRVGPIARRQLELLLVGQPPEGLTHVRQHLGLVSDFVAYHVVSRPLKSLRFLAGVMPKDEAELSGSP